MSGLKWLKLLELFTPYGLNTYGLNTGYPRKAEQVGRDSGARSTPLSRFKLVP